MCAVVKGLFLEGRNLVDARASRASACGRYCHAVMSKHIDNMVCVCPTCPHHYCTCSIKFSDFFLQRVRIMCD